MMTAVLAVVLTMAGRADGALVWPSSNVPVGQASGLPSAHASSPPSAQAPAPVAVQAADPALALDDTRWTLTKGTLTVAAPADTSTVTLAFGKGSLNAGSGCNRGTTSYQVRDGRLVAGMFAITRMACADPLMKWESAFFKFLASKPTVSREGEALVLKAGDEDLKFKLYAQVGAESRRPTRRQSVGIECAFNPGEAQ